MSSCQLLQIVAIYAQKRAASWARQGNKITLLRVIPTLIVEFMIVFIFVFMFVSGVGRLASLASFGSLGARFY